MFIRVKTTPNSPRKSIQIVESNRCGSKVSQKIVRHVGIAMDDNELEQLKHLAAEIIAKMTVSSDGMQQQNIFDNDDLVPDDFTFAMEKAKLGRSKRKALADILPPDKVSLADVKEEKRIVEGVHEVAGYLYDYLGFDQAVESKRLSQVLKNIVLLRAFDSNSKLKTSDILMQDYDVDNKVDAIYRMLDKVHDNIDHIKTMIFKQTQSLFPEKINMVLFDVTTLYFESTEVDELRNFGFSKDHKFNQTQVVLALATNECGLPIGYELFPGNKAEVSTLLIAINKWKETFEIGAVTIIADRAMCSKNNLAELDANGIGYIVAMPLRRSLKTNLQEQVLTDFSGVSVACHREYDFEDKRLIVSYSPDRARKDADDRARIVTKLESKLKKGDLKNLVSNHGYLKYITKCAAGTTGVDMAKINADKRWDGLHAVLTSDKTSPVETIHESYRRLWVIEESFRINKYNLEMRPIYHHKPERIKAHIAVCYMAFAIIRQLQYRIKIAQEEFSVDKIRETLLSVQSSILVHKKTNDYYRMPGKFSHTASKIYRAVGVTRDSDVSVYLKP